MELIKALEQLSLEVRNKNEILNISEPASSSWATDKWQSNNNTQPFTFKNFENQLQDFNNSVETLFTQITDLEITEPKFRSQIATTIKRNKFAHPLIREQDYSGSSMDTSQEEDSDCSLHQSSIFFGGTGRKTPQTNPLVRDLMKRDLSAITDTVRKISRILTLGNDIEIVYTNYLNGQQVDVAYSRSLCDAFLKLCSDEPHIEAMPTILKYSEYCRHFTNQLGESNPFCSTATDNLQQSSSAEKFNRSGNSNQLNNIDNDCDLDDDDDDLDYDELVEFNDHEISANTWYNNKLYKDNNQGFK